MRRITLWLLSTVAAVVRVAAGRTSAVPFVMARVMAVVTSVAAIVTARIMVAAAVATPVATVIVAGFVVVR